jgi:hypothetical protein
LHFHKLDVYYGHMGNEDQKSELRSLFVQEQESNHRQQEMESIKWREIGEKLHQRK